jgi:hypothetical protein
VKGSTRFETRNPLARAWESWSQEKPLDIADSGGAKTRMFRKITTRFDGRTVSFAHTFTNPGWGKPQISQSTLRFLGAASLSRFLADAHLVVEQQFGDWDRRPLTDASQEIITIARRR